MFIITTTISRKSYYFAGSNRAPDAREWPADRELAEEYDSEDEARTDLATSSPVFIRYAAVARIVPA